MMLKRPYESRGALTRTVSGSACGDASRRQASSLLMISVRKLCRERCDTANSPKELASLRLRIDSLTQIARRCSHATKDDVRTAIAVAGFGVSSWSRGGVHAGWFIAAAAAGLASTWRLSTRGRSFPSWLFGAYCTPNCARRETRWRRSWTCAPRTQRRVSDGSRPLRCAIAAAFNLVERAAQE